MKLAELLERLEYKVVQGDTGIKVGEINNDSRDVREGSVFVCIKGAVSDGHAYVREAAEKGAVAVVVEREVKAPEGLTLIQVADTRYALALMSAAYYGYPAEKLKVIGVTGTKGKTTTTYMIRSILEEVGHKVGLIGTIEARIGDRVLKAGNTTPESCTIQKYLPRWWRRTVISWSWKYLPRGLCSAGRQGSPLRSAFSPTLGGRSYRA